MNEITGFVPGSFQDTLPRDQRTYAPSHIGSDPARYLPAGEPSDRFQRLQLRVADLRALCPNFEERNDATNAKLAAERRVKHLLDPPASFGLGQGDESHSVVSAKRDLERLTAEATRINNLYTEREAAWSRASQTLAAVQSWLRGGIPGNARLEAIETEAPKLTKGEASILDAIENRRRQVKKLRADAHRLASAPFPSGYAKQRMRDQIERLAQRGAPNVSMLIERDGEIAWPMMRLTSQIIGVENGALAFGEVPDTALVAWTFKSALIAALDREIEAVADDRNALSPEVREQQDAEVQADLLAVERHEAALTWQAQAQGSPIEHRADISPLALLGLGLVTVSPAATLPASSPELAWRISLGS